jgi:cell division septum initiation protein DivIVA
MRLSSELARPIRKASLRGLAYMARQVNDFLLEIEKLRSEIEIATRQVAYLTGREQSMRQSSGAVAKTSGSSALAPRVDELEQDFGYQRERL